MALINCKLQVIGNPLAPITCNLQVFGDPLALITLPELWEPSSGHRVLIDTLEVRAGEVYVAGSTSSSAQEFEPPDKVANVARQP